MKTRLTLRTIGLLTLPLALLAQSSAWAQTQNEANPPSPASPGRQAISQKLESIRLDTVQYDGLPLGEVVNNLIEEARKRDPEKKGINIIINPNPPPEAAPAGGPVILADGTLAPAPPVEQVDVSSVSIRIRPPLTDVRLVDVLDAVVEVADRPIKYTVEDYGVVFALRGSERRHKDLPPSAAAPGSGRQIIGDKIGRIRLDSVSYDGLPLGEVVMNLRDVAKKRDPDKKGINFMINPNAPADDSAQVPMVLIGPDGKPQPLPPPEQVDVSSISVKIRPPLTDVRLVDVLDAVVKVADRPIKYTVEDYGVVFSLRGPEPAHRNDVIAFVFPGGTPAQFLDAVQRQYNVDWLSVADIPKEMADVRIPRLRINREALMSLGHGDDVGAEALAAVISLYNQLGTQKPELGHLVVQGGMAKPSVVMFVPDKSLTEARPKVKVKAFSIWGISDPARDTLLEDIERTKKEALDSAERQRGASRHRDLEGTVAIHKDTSLLVATGPESFVDLVDSIVTAFLVRERARNPSAPNNLPNQPAK
jgi:hypothetical protein